LLDQLIFDERHTPQEIVILSRWGDQDAADNNLPEMLKKITAPLKFGQKTDKIPYCSIHSFKGMEAPIIIITDIENIASTESQSLFYVGITRALDKLFILASKNASREINEILLGA
jgi:superfamily I DNA/RNA helicase